MSNPQRRKGTAAEAAVVAHLRNWWPDAERRALHGSQDLGDVILPRNIDLTIEIKNQRTYNFPAWFKQMQDEQINAKTTRGLLIIKPNGVGVSQIGNWWAVMSLDQAIELLDETR
jgi:hypothetical protein